MDKKIVRDKQYKCRISWFPRKMFSLIGPGGAAGFPLPSKESSMSLVLVKYYSPSVLVI